MESHIQIRSKLLRVDIAEPGTIYSGSRFDWTGFVTQVTLAGKHTFCTCEPDGGTEGAGLCNEFGISTPIGFDDAEPGEQFPKLGVGLLTRTEEKPYKFDTPYEIKPFPTSIAATADTVTFTQEPLTCRGYAAQFRKTLSVSENELRISYRLENTGEKSICTNEYVHNFISIDGNEIGPGYRLHLPDTLTPFAPTTAMNIDDRPVIWNAVPDAVFYYKTENPSKSHERMWELTYGATGVRERTDRPWELFALWGTSEVVSPEAFVGIDLPPGDIMEWERIYTFFSSK